jgi:hypothetical protein
MRTTPHVSPSSVESGATAQQVQIGRGVETRRRSGASTLKFWREMTDTIGDGIGQEDKVDMRESDRQALRDLTGKCAKCGARLVDEQEQSDGLCYDHA